MRSGWKSNWRRACANAGSRSSEGTERSVELEQPQTRSCRERDTGLRRHLLTAEEPLTLRLRQIEPPRLPRRQIRWTDRHATPQDLLPCGPPLRRPDVNWIEAVPV